MAWGEIQLRIFKNCKKKNLKKKNSLHKDKIMLKCGIGIFLGKRQLTVSLKLAQSVAVVVGDVRKV